MSDRVERGIYQYVRPGIEAIARFWKPFLLIQVCGLLIVILYFRNAHFQQIADSFGAFGKANGIPFAMIMCAIASAIIPELAKMITMGEVRWTKQRIDDMVFHLGLFAIMGLISIEFYAFQQWLWPADGRIITSIKKMALDQFIYSPFITLVVVSLGYSLRDVKWNPIRFVKMLGIDWYLSRVGKLIIPCWCFWIPMTTLMYSLPNENLTLIFSMTAQAAWALVMLFVAAKSTTMIESVETQE